jgi:hypothetical protein
MRMVVTTSSDTLQALLELERAGWESLKDGSGDEFYHELMTEDALMVLANGAVMDRKTVTAALGNTPAWTRYEIEDARIVGIGSEAAALVYRATAWRSGTDQPFVGAMSSVYGLCDGKWRLKLYQQTAAT